ncbi:MAG TPA: radical SAM protein [Methanomicrobiales archaeon]|nr:radical SAM protein [Methanomicrobiales archaeon]
MRVLLLNVPSRTVNEKFPPLGLLYVAGIVGRAGHEARIHDLYFHDLHLRRLDDLDRLVDEYQPDLIGFGGIASSYGKTRILSDHLRQRYPHILQMAGGSLASVYEFLLAKTAVDIVFHGETEQTLPVFLERVARNEAWTGIPGTSHRSDNAITRNPPAPQVEDLDSIPIPPYHLLNLPDYFNTTWDSVGGLLDDLEPHQRDAIRNRAAGKDRLHYLVTSRGCTNRCSFCYRHMKGYRQHSVGYVVRHLRLLMDTYGLRAFSFSDELFNHDRDWVLEFCDAVAGLDIVYLIGGARINRMDPELLDRLRESGCIGIAYGQESGSDAILSEFRKGVTAGENRAMTLATHDHGIPCPVQLVIGSPSETEETIRETLRFLLDVKAKTASVNYLIALPETPIWEEALRRIPNPEAYLDEVAQHGGAPLVNLTRVPDRIWRSWAFLLKTEMRLAAIRREKGVVRYLLALPVFRALEAGYRFIPGRVVKFLREARDRPTTGGS